MLNIIGKNILKSLILPKPSSHKRENGRLLIIGGSYHYFGALLYCLTTASRLVDLTYVLTTPENKKLLAKLKTQTAEFMPVDKYPHKQGFTDVDCILIGPGLGLSSRTKQLVRQALNSGKNLVLDADALNVLDGAMMKKLGPNCILTPHRREFKRVFNQKPSDVIAGKMSKKYHCTILLKSPVDIIATPEGKIFYNKTGNAGMTKGGTGDVLAGLIAGLFCKNSALIAAAAGAYINGQAGDDLYKKQKTFYNAEDLSLQIPKTLAKYTSH